MPYQTAAQWKPVLDDIGENVQLARLIIKSYENQKMTAKYLEEHGAAFEQTMSPAQIAALRSQFLALMNTCKTKLDAALA